MHDQYDVHAVQMEQSKIIKNTVQRTNPIILEKIDQVRCKATFTAIRPCRNRGRATRVRHLPCRYATISANDAKSTKNGEHRGDSLRCSTPTRSSKIPVTVNTGYLVSQNTQSTTRRLARQSHDRQRSATFRAQGIVFFFFFFFIFGLDCCTISSNISSKKKMFERYRGGSAPWKPFFLFFFLFFL